MVVELDTQSQFDLLKEKKVRQRTALPEESASLSASIVELSVSSRGMSAAAMELALSARRPLLRTAKISTPKSTPPTTTTTLLRPLRRRSDPVVTVVALAARQRGPRTATTANPPAPVPPSPSSPPPPPPAPPAYRPGGPIRILQVAADGSDAWRLTPVIECLRAGGVAVVPTDSFPALVVDSGCRDGPAKLYKAKGSSKEERKPLSILLRGFADVDSYTAGWPAPTPGSPALFRVAKAVLPGPYTLILPASNALPRHCVDADNPGKKKSRKSIGVRLPSHPVTRAILEELDRPLLAASVGAANGSGGDAAEIADFMGGRGAGLVEFVVDCESGAVAAGKRAKGGGGGGGEKEGGNGIGREEGSTVIDLTFSPPRLVRWGRGDPAPFLGEEGMAEVEEAEKLSSSG